MKKNVIRIPSGIQYIGDEEMKRRMPDFRFERGIYAKGLTGCGATTFALRDDEMNVVLLVPRKTLLRNKAEQTPDVQMVYGDITNDEIMAYLDGHEGRRKVFICTYDSAGRLRCLLGDTWEGYHLYVDEFHVLLSDAGFKSYVEMSLIDSVRDAEHQTWLSATPCLDEFIERMPHLKDLPFYELDWEDKEKVEIQNICCPKPMDALCRVVRMYQNGSYPVVTDGDRVMKSRTMNGMFSSVNGILNVVRHCGLTPADTDIICAETDENVEALKNMGFRIGRIPLRGEKRKMFTLCTSTAYMGMDFYGEDTCTFVFADCKQVNTAVDIRTELVQICGRERLKENLFRKTVIFIHNDWNGDIDLEEKLSAVVRKNRMSVETMELFNQPDLSKETREYLVNLVKREKKAAGDRLNYTYWDESSQRFRINELSILSDEYEARVQYSIYHDGTYVMRNLQKEQTFAVCDRGNLAVAEHVKNMVLKTTFAEKMEAYCNERQREEGNIFLIDYLTTQMERNDPRLKVYYDALGPERIRALGYKEKNLQEELNVKKADTRIRIALDKVIRRGDERTSDEWKRLLGKVYQELGVKKSAVRTQLEKLYGYRMVRHHRTDDFGKRYYTYEIV